MGFSLLCYCMYDTCLVAINIFDFDLTLKNLYLIQPFIHSLFKNTCLKSLNCSRISIIALNRIYISVIWSSISKIRLSLSVSRIMDHYRTHDWIMSLCISLTYRGLYSYMNFRASLHWYRDIHNSIINIMNMHNSHTNTQIWFISLHATTCSIVHVSSSKPWLCLTY